MSTVLRISSESSRESESAVDDEGDIGACSGPGDSSGSEGGSNRDSDGGLCGEGHEGGNCECGRGCDDSDIIMIGDGAGKPGDSEVTVTGIVVPPFRRVRAIKH